MSILQLLYRKEEILFFVHESDGKSNHTPTLADDRITVTQYNDEHSMPDTVKEQLLLHKPLNVMKWRFRQGFAKALVAKTKEDLVVAYGWIQKWQPFRKRFRQVKSDAYMLGPFWTHPHWRRKGLYGVLLSIAIAKVDNSKDICIYCDIANYASKAGIEKAGFRPISKILLRRYFIIFSVSKIKPL